jgi:hypothetical protein
LWYTRDTDVGDSDSRATSYGGGASRAPPAAGAHGSIHISSSTSTFRRGGRGGSGGADPGGIGSDRWLYEEPRRVERVLIVLWRADRSIGDAGGVGSSRRSRMDCELMECERERECRPGDGSAWIRAVEDVARNNGSEGRRP